MLPIEQQDAGIALGGFVDRALAGVSYRATRWPVLVVLALVCVAVLMKCQLWFHVPIGHDEFNCLQVVHRFLRGELAQPFQSFHVHFFSWLGAVSENEVTQAYLLAMFVPVLSLAFFRNTAGYFYVFILPSAALLCGYGIDLLRTRIDRGLPRMTPVCVAILGLLVIRTYAMWPPYSNESTQTTRAQRELLSVIHTAFADPVPYIDGCGMVASFPNAGFFMSSACVAPYVRAGHPILKESLYEKRPLFLLANVPHLDLGCERPPKSVVGVALLEEDWAAMRSYFVHHWGPLWVLGKQVHFTPETPAQSFAIVTPGSYTVEAEAQVRIDGRVCHDGDVLELTQGAHTIEGTDGTITLRWGSHLYRPAQPQRVEDLFMGKLG